jgi:hypothetical protein
MLNELNRMAVDLLGLHGYPVARPAAPATSPAAKAPRAEAVAAVAFATAAAARRRKPRRTWEDASRHYGESA